MNYSLIDLAKTLKSIESLQGAEEQMAAYFKKLGFDSFFYARTDVIDKKFLGSGTISFPVKHYPGEYLTRYEAMGYFNLDPVVHHCVQTKEPGPWNLFDKIDLSDVQKMMIKERKDCGLAAGISYPIFGGKNSYSGFSLASDQEKGFYENLKDKNEILYPSILYFHNFLQPFFSDTIKRPLTPRQTDCLRWMTEGLSSKQIANRMRIQEDTVNKHIQSIKEKLHAYNRIEAVVKAIKLGLICI